MREIFLYWDASALVSALLSDAHSHDARGQFERKGFHFISSLTEAELHAVLARMLREGVLTKEASTTAAGCLDDIRWTRSHVLPTASYMPDLASRWPLKGADLWHLALVKTLRGEMPELMLMTYDVRLREAAQGEGLAP